MKYVLTIRLDAHDYALRGAVSAARAAVALTPGVALISSTIEKIEEEE